MASVHRCVFYPKKSFINENFALDICCFLCKLQVYLEAGKGILLGWNCLQQRFKEVYILVTCSSPLVQ